jgi:hypothetical protein
MRHPIMTVAIRKPFDILFSFEAVPRMLTRSITFKDFHEYRNVADDSICPKWFGIVRAVLGAPRSP